MDIIKFLDEFTSEKLTAKSSSRREVFGTFGSLGKKAAMVAVPFGLAASSNKAFAAQTEGDPIAALQLALTLEYLEAEFYSMALQSGVIPSASKVEAIFNLISSHETSHVEFLKANLGDASVESPEFDFTASGAFDPFNQNGTGQETAYKQLLALAQAFEDTGVRAYKGQAGTLMGTPYLTPALQIHSVEARHASQIRRIRAEVIGEPLNVDALGWITLDHRGPGMPEATQPVYEGEAKVIQADVNLVDATGFSDISVSQSFDEPITGEMAQTIAGLFIKKSE